MNPSALLLALLALGCAHNETFRPRHAAMLMASEAMECSDVEAAYVTRAPYQIDPVRSASSLPIAVWGCGKSVRLLCSPFGSRAGTCVDDPFYHTPPEWEPQGIVKIRTTYHDAEGVTQREIIRIGDRVVVRTPSSTGRALGLPVRAGRERWSLESSPVFERTSTGAYAGYHSVHTYTTVTRHTGQGCGRELSFEVAPDAVYRLELEYYGANRCEVHCAQEIETPGGTALIDCQAFELL